MKSKEKPNNWNRQNNQLRRMDNNLIQMNLMIAKMMMKFSKRDNYGEEMINKNLFFTMQNQKEIFWHST